MNLIWIVSDTFRWDHLGVYGNKTIRTPSIDAFASRCTRFNRHYANGFPTMPTRADHMTGRFTMSFMAWEPLPKDVTTIAQILSQKGYTTCAVADTPFYLREGMNYDRGFQAFFMVPSQDASLSERKIKHESWDRRAAWRYESDRAAPQTFSTALGWLERHYKEDFFLYVDTWDPHEPWDAPSYYTELYWPNYDGEVIDPLYGHWQDKPGFTEEKVKKAHATYCGEVTMVDTWVGHFLRILENMGLMDKTAIIFTTDHGFLFGEHGGIFGKGVLEKLPDGTLPYWAETVGWSHDPLYEEVVRLPLLVYIPGIPPGTYGGLTAAVDVMPTTLDILEVEVPHAVEGQSLLPKMRDPSLPGREFVVSGRPFTNAGEGVKYVDNVTRPQRVATSTAVTTPEWSLLYTVETGHSQLFNLTSDPSQEKNLIEGKPDVASEVHQCLVKFMKDTNLSERLLKPRLHLDI